jgi:hypothetical protein
MALPVYHSLKDMVVYATDMQWGGKSFRFYKGTELVGDVKISYEELRWLEQGVDYENYLLGRLNGLHPAILVDGPNKGLMLLYDKFPKLMIPRPIKADWGKPGEIKPSETPAYVYELIREGTTILYYKYVGEKQ